MSNDETPESSEERVSDALIQGTWYHSFEEDVDSGVRTYRPSSYDFPPTRMPRLSLRLEADHVLADGTAGADDRTIESGGSWSLVDGKLVTEVAGRSETYLIEIQEQRALALRAESRESTEPQNGGKEEE